MQLEIGTDCTFARLTGTVSLGSALEAGGTISVDTAGYNGCCLVVSVGDISLSGGVTLKVYESTDNGVVDTFTALEGVEAVLAYSASNTIAYFDIDDGSRSRYLSVGATSGEGAGTIESIVAVLYGAGAVPVSQPAAKVSGGGRYTVLEREVT